MSTPKSPQHQFSRWIPPWALVLVCLGVCYQALTVWYRPSVDLPSFFGAARLAFRDHHSPYDLPALRQIDFGGNAPYPFLYPPTALVFFAPLSLVSYEAARWLFFALNVGSSVFIAFTIARLLPHREHSWVHRLWPILASVFVFSEPVHSTFEHGQVNLILLALILAFWRAAVRRHLALAGLALASTLCVKIYFALFLLLLPLRREYRVLAWTIGWTFSLIALTAMCLPLEWWSEWRDKIVYGLGYSGVVGSIDWLRHHENHSLFGVLSRLESSTGTRLRDAFYILGSAALVFPLGGAWWGNRINGPIAAAEVALALVTICLISPLTWTHHLVWTLPALIVVGGELADRASSTARWCAFITTVVLVSFPIGIEKILGISAFWGLFALYYQASYMMASYNQGKHVQPADPTSKNV